LTETEKLSKNPSAASQIESPRMAYWSVAQTENRRESTAADWLQRAGFETYLPKIKIVRQVIRGHTRAHERMCSISRVEPLFPSYLFVRVVDRWYAIANTIGVMQLLLAGNQPAPIADQEINKIKAKERGGLIRLPPPPRIKLGDQVRVLRGTFADHIGIYDGMSGKQRERVLLDLLGQRVPVLLPSADIAMLQS
jgi:transcriptional antiterminator RfaH